MSAVSLRDMPLVTGSTVLLVPSLSHCDRFGSKVTFFFVGQILLLSGWDRIEDFATVRSRFVARLSISWRWDRRKPKPTLVAALHFQTATAFWEHESFQHPAGSPYNEYHAGIYVTHFAVQTQYTVPHTKGLWEKPFKTTTFRITLCSY